MTNRVSIEGIVSGVRKGDKRSASQLMSMVERATPESEECLKILRGESGRSHILGVTGWPGVGKSTLISHIARSLLNNGNRVGIIAVDPTSPVSGGSFLGDRLRMREIDGDERLFIRSMATRGHPGGIAAATDAFIRIMEAMDKEVVIVETVGVGQDQVSVSDVADTVIMTVIPGMGDYLQALKAGIMELGDIFVVNKADRKGVEEVIADLRMTIGMSEKRGGWIPPIVKTVAVENSGIAELMTEIARHKDHITRCGVLYSKRVAAAKLEILRAVQAQLVRIINERTGFEEKLGLYAEQVIKGRVDRNTLVAAIFREIGIVVNTKGGRH
jgi:LAO/AO transport system kinase